MALGEGRKLVATSGQTNIELWPVDAFANPEIADLLRKDGGGSAQGLRFDSPYGRGLQEMIDYMTGATPDYAGLNLDRIDRAGQKLGQISGMQQAMGNMGALTGKQVTNATENAMGVASSLGHAAEAEDAQNRRNMIPSFEAMVQAPEAIRASAPHVVKEHTRNIYETTRASKWEGLAQTFGTALSMYTRGAIQPPDQGQ